MASGTSRIRWTKEVQHKLDGGTITSYDKKLSKRFRIHIWQMYGPGNKWNWCIFDHRGYDRDTIMQSNIHGHITAKEAKMVSGKAWLWYFTMMLLRDSDNILTIKKGFENV